MQDSGGSTDNEALHEIRNILKESRKQTWIMISLTILIAILTIILLIRT